MRKEKPKPIEGKINFSSGSIDEKNLIYEMTNDIKKAMGAGNPNKDILFEVMTFYIKNNITQLHEDQHMAEENNIPFLDCSFTSYNEETSTQKLFVTAETSIENLIKRVINHGKVCKSQFHLNSTDIKGHVGVCKLKCEEKHELLWSSSPYMGDKYLCNLRMSHGFYVSGMLPNQYSRFCQASKIGTIGETTLNSIFHKYAPEIASYEKLQEGIDIVTDARHGTRKNSMYTDVVCLGARTHTVLRVETISKVDCTSAQKHELIGTERIYEYFKNLRDDYEVKIRVHCHDRNTSVNKFIRINGIDTESTNDTWHATKNIAKKIKTICSGPRYKEGQTLHPELSDKAASIKTHLYWAMKNCNKDPVKLKLSLLNIVEHYKNNQEHCSELSRCKTDSNYEPTKYLIKDPKAEMLLGRALMNIQVYKSPTDYVHCMDSYYVESFNNAILQYHDKRINFSKQVYILRTNLAILDWKEHVNRQTKSLKTVQDANNPRRQLQVKILKRKSYNMWSEISHQPMENLRRFTRETFIDIPANIESQEHRRRQNNVMNYPEHPRASTTDDDGGTFVREFCKRLDPNIPFYYWTQNERFKLEHASFDKDNGQDRRLHVVSHNQREDSNIFTAGRSFLPARNKPSIRQRLFRLEIGLPPVPENLQHLHLREMYI
ncbi:unnamed protein product [Mytilus coruscus]|uniref:Uncharacterized protein n=1 Tax=Mytilus coruscus TaxID=42192 RepID=A0A6J8C8Q5_MYTCO|nr:unnamed protein product [Mytilus coruscus]